MLFVVTLIRFCVYGSGLCVIAFCVFLYVCVGGCLVFCCVLAGGWVGTGWVEWDGAGVFNDVFFLKNICLFVCVCV